MAMNWKAANLNDRAVLETFNKKGKQRKKEKESTPFTPGYRQVIHQKTRKKKRIYAHNEQELQNYLNHLNNKGHD